MNARSRRTSEVLLIAGLDTLVWRFTLAVVVVTDPAGYRFSFADLEGDG